MYVCLEQEGWARWPPEVSFNINWPCLHTQSCAHMHRHISQEKMNYKNSFIITSHIFTFPRCLDKVEIRKHVHLKGNYIQVVYIPQEEGQTFWWSDRLCLLCLWTLVSTVWKKKLLYREKDVPKISTTVGTNWFTSY